jgi:hypothetical protein
MSPLEVAALKFWNAAIFHRRAPARDQTIADRILIDAARSDFTPIRLRAIQILKEQPHVAEPSRAE